MSGSLAASPWTSPAAEQAAHELATRVADRVRQSVPGLRARGEARVGGAAAVLVEASRSARLVVVGTRGHGGLASALLGSTAVAVTSHAHCPVLVVTGEALRRADSRRPVVVGVDGSPSSQVAVRLAAETAAASGADLEVVAAWQRLLPLPGSGASWYAIVAEDEADDLVRESARTVGEAAVAAAKEVAAGLTVRLQVVEGPPVSALLVAARTAGLVVVGARGRGAVAGLLLGSVSQQVLHGAPCPVLVVRAGPDHRPGPALVSAAPGQGSSLTRSVDGGATGLKVSR